MVVLCYYFLLLTELIEVQVSRPDWTKITTSHDALIVFQT